MNWLRRKTRALLMSSRLPMELGGWGGWSFLSGFHSHREAQNEMQMLTLPGSSGWEDV